MRFRHLAPLPLLGLTTGLFLLLGSPAAFAAQPQVGLGEATPYAVLAGTTVTNTGPSVISGDVGVAPGSAITGFPPGGVVNGAQHAADADALRAQNDLTTAYNDAAGRIPVVDKTDQDLGNQILLPGVYGDTGGMELTGTVTLDGQGDPDAVFIFQAGSTLITASNSVVALTGAARACNVFWQVGSSATLGTDTTFVGSILALTSASLQTGATVAGRVLARNGQVSLDSNTITQSSCSNATGTGSPTPTPSGTPSATVAPSATVVPSAVVVPSSTRTPRRSPTSGGGGTPTGPGSPTTPSPVVPVGHPETGTTIPAEVSAAGRSSRLGWLAAGVLSLGGSAVIGFGGRRSRRPSRR